MAKEKVGLVKTPLDELTYKINGFAMQVMRELRSGHKEEFYQRRLAELCRDAGLRIELEKRVEVWVNELMIGYLYLDLWIENSLVVECKALSHDLTNHELHQVLVYLAATGSPIGMIYNFGRSTLEFKRVLRPVDMQDWQKYLYRVIWTPPGAELPQEDSFSSNTPIRFSVISDFADQPSVLPSVPVRDSATESASNSVPIRDSVTESAYNNAGVSITAGNLTVDLMKDAVKSTYTSSVLAGIGSFGGLYDASILKMFDKPVLVASTDGVGTKVKLAAQVGRYRSIGHDIVNHCINDILVQGARPLFFMDYFATSKLTPEVTAEVVTGVAEACKEAGMVLLGGETAEMPGVYQPNEFDIAGTIVGVVERDNVLPRPNLNTGDVLIGLTSSGPHTNGYSLIRKIFSDTALETNFPELGISLADALLAPHKSYLNLLSTSLTHSSVKALAHLTGGGFIENIPRILSDDLDAVIHLDAWTPPPLWKLIQQKGNIATDEMYHVFNMGIGMAIVVDKTKAAEIQSLIPEPTFIIGELVKGERKFDSFNKKDLYMPSSLPLRYGINPQQAPARVFMKSDADLPITILNGSPGYINLLDALNSWQLVRELKAVINLPAAASFKHVSPSGVAVGTPLSDVLKKIYFVDDLELSPLAAAYARARGVDRMSSFGDWIALSDTVDIATAKLISREVSDGVIAPAYEPEALEILKKKKQGKYAVVQIDSAYEPPALETRDIFGVTFEQRHHDRSVTRADFANIVTKNKELPESAIRDMLIAWITLKYTQSNSVCYAADGQIIGVGAGQQSRVHCTRLAGAKADLWRLRQHPSVLTLPFKPDIKRPDRDNAIDQFLQPDVTEAEKANWANIFSEMPRQLTVEERRVWLDGMSDSDVVLGSDAFFPFRDSIDRAVRSGVKYVLQPGGSNRDEDVIAACDEYGMTMVFSGVRLFHH